MIIGPTVKGITDEVTLGEGVEFVNPPAENSTETQEEETEPSLKKRKLLNR
ncbi:hypothetical protein BGP_6246 [Beggiatoa sp. PS]|nr:hypothetical protein BGP_6246 [Beggiatoa sp. PS]